MIADSIDGHSGVDIVFIVINICMIINVLLVKEILVKLGSYLCQITAAMIFKPFLAQLCKMCFILAIC